MLKRLYSPIYMFHIDELLPEILISLYTVFREARKINKERFNADIHEMMDYIDQIILNAFMHYSEEIQER